MPDAFRSAANRGRRVISVRSSGGPPARRDQLAPFPFKRRCFVRLCVVAFASTRLPFHTFPAGCRDIRIFGFRIGLPRVDERWYPSIRSAIAGKEPYVPADSSQSFGRLLGHPLRVVPPTLRQTGSRPAPSRTTVHYPRAASSVPDPSSTLAKPFAFSSAELPRR